MDTTLRVLELIDQVAKALAPILNAIATLTTTKPPA